MAFPKHVWNQLKNITADDLESALKRDGYVLDPASSGAIRAYVKKAINGNSRVAIHWHPHKTYGANLLKGLLWDAGWTEEEDLVRIGLIASGGKKSKTISYLIPCTSCDRGIVGTGNVCPDCGGTGHREILEMPDNF